ncbi:pirin family protein [Zeaxanthinibacter enoshimensis]|uniref:Pirin N-terminal domain-containing protein n=1 Tax=Zeaxanthinibacter enoshimensis TaxID=392009 RepID=A0A4R6TLU3_9FLAO|nr:pirin family protein [Zeaxanthinibacter enoshimensis]TDQ30669.1 hypothetical protein CLV82_1356 [Zeaxanthinibacter enoshimensis]
MKKDLHTAASRGHANHGWLNSYHTFSFASYYNPERMNFGVLRVLNDDEVAPGMGFGTHPHKNMEIISIPLQGDLEHKDSMGNTEVIREGDIQVMSAGTGVRHSEYNRNKDKPVKFLQIWIIPKAEDVVPRYDQITLRQEKLKNRFYQVLSPTPDDGGVWIHQDAWFHIGHFEAGQDARYDLKKKDNGLYVFVLEGNTAVGDTRLSSRDGLAIQETDSVDFSFPGAAKILLMEVPMKL